MLVQVPRGTSQTITAMFYDGETPKNVATATLGVIASDGTEIIAPGTSVSEGDEGWEHVLPPVAECDQLTATWTGIAEDSSVWTVADTIEVVGGFYFSLNDLKSMPDIVDNDTYNGQYALARRWIETLIERTVDVSFVERYFSDVLPRGRNGIRLVQLFPRRILSVALDGTPLSTDEFDALVLRRNTLHSRSRHLSPCWDNATVRYVAGYSYNGAVPEPPEDLRIAALTAARNRLLSVDGASGIPSRARSITNQLGNISLTTAGGPDSPTGYPEVDSIICGWRDNVNGVVAA